MISSYISDEIKYLIWFALIIELVKRFISTELIELSISIKLSSFKLKILGWFSLLYPTIFNMFKLNSSFWNWSISSILNFWILSTPEIIILLL